jgi:hypothetical protein
MLIKALQRFIASIGVRKVNRAIADMVLNIGHEGLRGDRLHYLGLCPAVALKEYKNDASTPNTSALMPLTSTHKVESIHFNLDRDLSFFQFCNMKWCRPQSLVNPSNSPGVQAQITGKSISRLLPIKILQDDNLAGNFSKVYFIRLEHTINMRTAVFMALQELQKTHLRPFKKLVA